MKTLIMSLFFCCMYCFVFAQTPTDTTNMNKKNMDTLPPTNNTNLMDSSSMMNNNNNNRMDSSSMMNNNSMNNNNRMDSSSMMNNNSMNNNNRMDSSFMNNMPGMRGYAALPVLESYVPADIVSKVKERYGNTVYDITSIKVMPDSSLMNHDSTMTTHDSTMNQMGTGANAAMPQQFNYAVRFEKNGMMNMEVLNNDASALVPGKQY